MRVSAYQARAALRLMASTRYSVRSSGETWMPFGRQIHVTVRPLFQAFDPLPAAMASAQDMSGPFDQTTCDEAIVGSSTAYRCIKVQGRLVHILHPVEHRRRWRK